MRRTFSVIVGLTTTLTTNLLNPGTTTGGVNCTAAPYDKLRLNLRQIRVTNTSATPQTVTLYKGLTGANTVGTELIKGVSIPANSYTDFWFQDLSIDTTQFIVGGASGGSSNDLNAQFNGEIGIA